MRFSLLLSILAPLASADVGTAGSWSVPYLPTRCNGNSRDQFPPKDLFVSVGDGLWDNGAACGRQYLVRCISSLPRACKSGTIQVKVVDFSNNPVGKKSADATMHLSTKAWAEIVDTSKGANKVNIEFQQV
ncbi:uncharacterized protein CLUP02_04202 [Colletotrichum lupini]|uniref:Expansin-like EG45 domain-containing protein n=1 Tax=Colletotrichum lupini TaxID=145971 RepID=A0A9Q8WDJ4_9PEZI|nr:uncharacterized protein CLUP02_04202 [Colletotrichum lupini]KAK1709181.1 hypothetical protein BDP67DRAFT_597102 [Colletotrichum lupini]UQC78725.1 hypothetical protein CLUP02_04202 [Colletotrichum lupini]